VAQAGSLAAGHWQAEIPGARVSFELQDDGWVVAAASKETGFLELRRFDRPAIFLDVVAARQAFTKAGGVVPVRAPDQLISTLQRNPRLELAVRPHRRYPASCERPCVPLFASQGSPFLVIMPSVMRVSVLQVGAQTVAVTEEPRSGFRLTGQVVRGLRFR
jgi:hypothetical protein